MSETKTRTAAKWGVDYDGWALPLSGDGGAPYWSHFTASRMRPASPNGCVPVKLVPLGRPYRGHVNLGGVPVKGVKDESGVDTEVDVG